MLTNTEEDCFGLVDLFLTMVGCTGFSGSPSLEVVEVEDAETRVTIAFFLLKLAANDGGGGEVVVGGEEKRCTAHASCGCSFSSSSSSSSSMDFLLRTMALTLSSFSVSET